MLDSPPHKISSNMKNSPLLLLAFALLPAFLPAQVSTDGDNSPAVVADKFHAEYGVRPDAVLAILKIYEKDIPDAAERKRRTEALLKKYQQVREKTPAATALSDASKSQLGLANAPELASALDWDLFARKNYLSLYTSGANSPAVYAPGGEVTIWYGIPPAALRALAARLEENKVELGDFEKRLETQVKKYEELKAELTAYGEADPLMQQAEKLLEAGKLTEVEQLLDSAVALEDKQLAYRHFVDGKVKEVLLKYEEAGRHYGKAVALEPENSDYLIAYAFNEYTLAHFDEAIAFCQKAVAIDTVEYREKPEKTSLLYNQLGLAWKEKGDYERAITFLKKALAIDTIVFGNKNSRVATEYDNLGLVYKYKGEYDRAINLYEKALIIDSSASGNKHPNIATHYNNLGVVWREKGENDRAISSYEKALAIDSIAFGFKHPFVATEYNNLGAALEAKGKYDLAIAFLEKARTLDSMIFGNKHPTAARDFCNLGTAWGAKGEYSIAIAFIEKAVTIDSIIFGSKHPNVALRYYNLGGVWQAKGEFARAIKFYEKALAIDSIALEKNHPHLTTDYVSLCSALNSLGLALQAKGEYERAIPLLEKALAINSKIFGNQYQDLAFQYNNLGMVWGAKGEYTRAIVYLEKALAIDTFYLGDKHPDVATDYNNLGFTWKKKGKYDYAIELYEKALAIDSLVLGIKHPDVAIRYNNLGAVWHDKGEYERAIVLYEKALAIQNPTLGGSHPRTKATAQYLSMAANNRGMEFFQKEQYAAALPYFQKALTNAEAAEDWDFSLTCLNNIGSAQEQIKQYKEGLDALDKGIERAEKIIKDKEAKENLPLLRRMRYHRLGCLAGLGRRPEAEALAPALYEEAVAAHDARTAEDLKKDGWVK